MKPLLLQRRLGDLLALLAGGCLPLAFAPFSVFPMAILSAALLFLLWQNIFPPQAFWRGFLYGIGMFGIGVSWVYVSFSQFGNIPLIGSILLTVAFVLVMALYPALLGWLVTRLFPDDTPAKLLLVLPAAWTLMEWLRGWLFTGFPWLSLGYSQIDSPLNGFAPLLGVYGVSWIVVGTASLLLFIWESGKLVWLVLSLLVTLWGSGWLLSGQSWTQATGKPVKVALIQGNIPQDFKWLSAFQEPTLQRYLEQSQQQREVDLVIWPETAIPMYYHQAKGILDYLSNQHALRGIDFLIGIPVMRKEGEYFNSVISISHEEPFSFYYKRHLVPFGEYIPFQKALGSLLQFLNIPMSEFSAGPDHQANLIGAGQAIGVSICYEDAYGELVRSSLPAARLLVNVSNDAWFGASIAPPQHLEIARMRALETGRYLLRATNTGISAVIDAKGKVVAQAPQFQIYSLRAQAMPYQGETPYVRFGNGLVVSGLVLLLLVGGVIQYRQLRR
jgi:apolipoprotein N-acyltransferase